MLQVHTNENVTVHKAPERQAAVQEKLSTGRVVRQSLATARIPGRMAGASSTSRQTITRQSGAVKRTADFPTETASAKRFKGPETTRSQQAKDTFRKQLDNAFEKLQKECKSAPDDLSFCLTVIDTYRTLELNLNDMPVEMAPTDYYACLDYLLRKMSELYNKKLDKVLDFFQDQIANGQIWIYTDKLDKVARGFDKLGYRFSTHNMTALKTIWNAYVNNEMDYLKYLKGSPGGSYPAQRAIDNIARLTSASSPAHTLGLMSDQDRDKINKQANSLYKGIIHSGMKHSDAGKKKENVLHGATDIMMEKRKHHDQIQEEFYKLNVNYQTAHRSGCTMRQTLVHMQKLLELHRKYSELVNNSHTQLFEQLNKVMTQLTNEIQNKLERGDYDDDQKMKEEISKLVDNLKKEKWFNREQKSLYSGFIQSQSTVTPDIREHKKMSDRIHEILDGLFSTVHNTSHDCDDDMMAALEKFKQLIDTYEDKLYRLPPKVEMGIRSRQTALKTMFFSRLFDPIVKDYNNHCVNALKNIERSCDIMHRHKDRFAKLNPYTSYIFISLDDKSRMIWQWAACFAWLDDLRHLRHQKSFSEGDVDNLLDLKDAAPTLPLHQARDCLWSILTNLFCFMLNTSPGTALIEKVTKLSEWIDNIDRQQQHWITQTLHEYNEKWRKKHVSEDGRATTSSYASATRMPSSMRPGILSAFPEAFDCHPCKGLQDVPHTRQFSTPCPGVPTPAPCGSFRQSVSSIPHRTPIAQQPAARSRPLLPPWLTVWPFLPRVPAPACNGVDFFHRPPVCGQIQPWRQQRAASQQQHGPRRPAMPFEYGLRYPFSGNIR